MAALLRLRRHDVCCRWWWRCSPRCSLATFSAPTDELLVVLVRDCGVRDRGRSWCSPSRPRSARSSAQRDQCRRVGAGPAGVGAWCSCRALVATDRRAHSTNPYHGRRRATPHVALELLIPVLLTVLVQWGLVRRRWLRAAGERGFDALAVDHDGGGWPRDPQSARARRRLVGAAAVSEPTSCGR